MRKLLVAMAALLSAGYVSAGDYHISTTLRCSQCHAMHASRQHQLNGAAVDPDYTLGMQGVGYRNLLIMDGTNATCLACHNAQSAYPDVLGSNSSATAFGTDNARSAGALNGTVVGYVKNGSTGAMELGSHTPGTATDGEGTAYADWMGHTLGTDLPPPGWVGLYEPSPQENFNCANCHEVHGSAAYRNAGGSTTMGLPTQKGAGNPFATNYPVYNALPVTGGSRAAVSYTANHVNVSNLTARDYKTASVTFGQGASAVGGAGMNAYCAVCHGNFHGTANTLDQLGGVDFVRHPTSGIVHDATKAVLTGGEISLVRPAWVSAAGGTNSYEAACLSCHKAHGNARGYGLLYPLNDGVTATADFEQGDALADAGVYPLRNLCITCHTQGR